VYDEWAWSVGGVTAKSKKEIRNSKEGSDERERRKARRNRK